MNNISNIAHYQPQSNDRFFFDANIWMYLYCPLGNYNNNIIRKYDNFFKQILKNRSTVFISSLVLSEFINTYLKLEFNILKYQFPDKYSDFKKDFRNTEKYKNLIRDISTTLKGQILKFAKRIDDNFKKIDLDKILFDLEHSDFNDNYYINLCEIEKIKIVTHDKDFRVKDIKVHILTASNSLLRKF